jgi:hypothetical protein
MPLLSQASLPDHFRSEGLRSYKSDRCSLSVKTEKSGEFQIEMSSLDSVTGEVVRISMNGDDGLTINKIGRTYSYVYKGSESFSRLDCYVNPKGHLIYAEILSLPQGADAQLMECRFANLDFHIHKHRGRHCKRRPC